MQTAYNGSKFFLLASIVCMSTLEFFPSPLFVV